MVHLLFGTQPTHTGKTKRIRKKVNHIKLLSDRKAICRKIIADLTTKLTLGWNPLVEAKAPKGYVKLRSPHVKGKVGQSALFLDPEYIKQFFPEWTLDKNNE